MTIFYGKKASYAVFTPQMTEVRSACFCMYFWLVTAGPSRSWRSKSESSIWYIFSNLTNLRGSGSIFTMQYYSSSLAMCVHTDLASVTVHFIRVRRRDLQPTVSRWCACGSLACALVQCESFPLQFGVL